MTRRKLADALFIGALMAYVLVGLVSVPVHADEFMQISMGRDVYYVLHGQFDRVWYAPPIQPDTEQHLRLLNGTLNKDLIGLTLAVTGHNERELPGIYAWAMPLDWNRTQGNVPPADLLNLARIPSALLTALGVLVIFGVGMRLAGRPMAYPAAFLYALHPIILLNGRRAMMEGGLLLGSLLVIGAATLIAQHPERWRRGVILLGLSGGFALCAKHTALFIVAGAFVAAFICWGLRYRWRAILYTALAGALVVLIFFVMNPAYWRDPVGAANATLSARGDLLATQVKNDPATYTSFTQRLQNTLLQPFAAPVQYYEAPTWTGVIDADIRDYETLPVSGWQWPTLVGVILTAGALAGLVLIGIQSPGDPVMRSLFVLVIACIAGALTIPLGWQRYYLPGLPMYILCAAYVPAFVRQRIKRP